MKSYNQIMQEREQESESILSTIDDNSTLNIRQALEVMSIVGRTHTICQLPKKPNRIYVDIMTIDERVVVKSFIVDDSLLNNKVLDFKFKS